MIETEYLLTGLMTMIIIGICVAIHYEGLRLLSDKLPMPKVHHRRRMILLILFIIVLHVVQIWIFGLVYYGLLQLDGYGELHGMTANTLIDCIYFSASVYTTVGFGDIYPTGAIRTMTGSEGLTGLTMITWSASFTYLQMLKTWDDND